jgi:hypothetical protein
MMSEDKAKKVADRIAARLQSSENAGSYDGADWDNLQSRLDQMYRDIRAGKPTPKIETQPNSTVISKAKPAAPQGAAVLHPSQERFNINEAIVDELVEFFEQEKACSLEPSGKPCDHCSMCSSRGF